MARTISLTRVKEGNHYENILKKKFSYDEHVRRRVHIRREFLEQKRKAEKLHHQRFIRLVSDTIDNVNKFITNSLDLNKTGLFDRQRDQIHGETLFLDMHISDHELTFALIEESAKELVKNLHVLRLKANLAKKRSIPDLLEPSKQSKKVFIIVEQAECLTRVLTETLVGYLKSRLLDETSPTDAIMILFCLSIKIQTLPFDNMHCFGRMKGISKHSEETSCTRLNELLRSIGLKVKLAPDTLDFINLHSLNADASITNITYLHCYCIFEHYYQLNEKSMLAEQKFQMLEQKHQSLCDDLQCLAMFLYEPGVWPEDVSDIYEEIGTFDDLSQSESFFNAIQGIKKIPHSRLNERLERVENVFKNQKQDKKNVVSILLSYKEKISNNKDCMGIVSQLVDDVMKYCRHISCPFIEHPNFYFNDRESLIRGCFTSSRGSAEMLNAYSNESSHFGVFLRKILQSQGQIAAGELCEQEEDEEKNGLARALFADQIDSMEHQGLVKLDAKGKIIKRLAWPMKTNCK